MKRKHFKSAHFCRNSVVPTAAIEIFFGVIPCVRCALSSHWSVFPPTIARLLTFQSSFPDMNVLIVGSDISCAAVTKMWSGLSSSPLNWPNCVKLGLWYAQKLKGEKKGENLQFYFCFIVSCVTVTQPSPFHLTTAARTIWISSCS